MISGQWLMVDGGRVRRGFTLIELLVVTVIMSLVICVIASCLAGGIRVWDSVYRHRSSEAGVDVALRLMEKDLMNSFQFYGISFIGGSRDVSFPGLVKDQKSEVSRLRNPGSTGGYVEARVRGFSAQGGQRSDPEEKWPEERIGTIKYFFDESRKVLFRKEWACPVSEPHGEHFEKVISDLEDINLEYYALPVKKDATMHSIAGTWQEFWDGSTTNFPDGVRIELSFMDKGKLLTVGRTVLFAIHN